MRYLRNDITDPYYNMALDEYALERLAIDTPLFYLWQNHRAVIIGANQSACTEVDLDYLRGHGITLARRVTGGGAVYHDLGNLNYTIVGRNADLNRDYPEYAGHILRALQALGVEATLSGRNDILVGGRKVSGYAKRVYKDRLMVHGTLMYDVDLATLEGVLSPRPEKLVSKGIASVRSRVTNLRGHLPQVNGIAHFKECLERHLSANYTDAEYLLTDADRHAIKELAQHKFATPEWIYGRRISSAACFAVPSTPPHTIRRTARLHCGTVEATLAIVEGHIATCLFGGDFIGNSPIISLESALCGVRYERCALRQRLVAIHLTDYLDGVDTDSLLDLLCPMP